MSFLAGNFAPQIIFDRVAAELAEMEASLSEVLATGGVGIDVTPPSIEL